MSRNIHNPTRVRETVRQIMYMWHCNFETSVAGWPRYDLLRDPGTSAPAAKYFWSGTLELAEIDLR